MPFDYYATPEELTATDRQLFDKAQKAREKAYAPYSEFLVGCAILLENGEIISGNNQENAAYPSGLCAERATIFWTVANFPNVPIHKIFIVGGSRNFSSKPVPVPPCGACRQSILEYETRQNYPIKLYFASIIGEIYVTASIQDLLPFSFDAKFL